LTIYICFLYKYDSVYTGFEPVSEDSDSRYIKQPKLEYILISAIVTVLLLLIYTYTLIISYKVITLYDEGRAGGGGEGEEEKLMSPGDSDMMEEEVFS
jgi:hypothetical protein